MFYKLARMCTMFVLYPRKLEEGVISSTMAVTWYCELPCGCWELNPGPLEEEPVPLRAEPSPQPGPVNLLRKALCQSVNERKT